MLRGINRYDIFHDDEDYLRFLETLERIKVNDSYEIFAYCLLSNHVRLLLHEKKDEISKTMKRIGVSYAWWYNWKYNRIGHILCGKSVSVLQGMEKKKRNIILRRLKEIDGITQRQIARITGINKSTVSQA